MRQCSISLDDSQLPVCCRIRRALLQPWHTCARMNSCMTLWTTVHAPGESGRSFNTLQCIFTHGKGLLCTAVAVADGKNGMTSAWKHPKWPVCEVVCASDSMWGYDSDWHLAGRVPAAPCSGRTYCSSVSHSCDMCGHTSSPPMAS